MITFVTGNIRVFLSHTRTHILKTINISWKWIAWPVFFLSVYFLIHSFTTFVNQHHSVTLLQLNFSGVTLLLVFLVTVLCLVNWWLESFKWKIMVNQITHCDFRTAAHSVLMGCSFGFITPNRVGDYAGRTIPFAQSLRPQLVTLNLVSGFSQFLAVVLCGLISAFLYRYELSFVSPAVVWVATVLVAGIFIMFVLLAVYPSWVSTILKKTGIKNSTIHQSLSFQPLKKQLVVAILTISTVRAIVFILQLVLVIKILSPQVTVYNAGIAGGVYFAVLTLSPSLVFNKLGLREALSVLILVPVTFSPVVAAVAVFALWFINQVIPVLLGSVLLIKRSVQA